MTSSAWYALRVAPGALSLRRLGEDKLDFPIVEIMRRRGITPFVPVESIFIRRDRFHIGAKKRVKRALLPGMVFLHLAHPVNWWSLVTIPMVHSVFTLNGEPYSFPEAGIERLHAITDDLRQPEFYRPMPTRRGYSVGDDVVDLTGMFEGKLKVTEVTGEVAKFLVPFFGEMREITTTARSLAKAAE